MAGIAAWPAQGLGCMGLSCPLPAVLAADAPRRAYSTALQNSTEDKEQFLRDALDHGVNLFNTGNIYTGPAGSNEELIGRAFKTVERSKFIISTKFGIELPSWRNDVAKDKVRGHCLAALGRLQMDYIDVFMVCRIPKDIITPIEETMKGLKALVEEGKIKAIGLNKPTADQIKRAHAVHPVACVEHEYSVFSRGIEDTILPLCKKLGIKVLCYSPVGGGMLKTKPADGEEASGPAGDEATEAHLAPLAKLAEEAELKGCSSSQLALAWLHAQGPDVIPIPGTTRLKHLIENYKATTIALTAEEASALGSAITQAYGSRR